MGGKRKGTRRLQVCNSCGHCQWSLLPLSVRGQFHALSHFFWWVRVCCTCVHPSTYARHLLTADLAHVCLSPSPGLDGYCEHAAVEVCIHGALK